MPRSRTPRPNSALAVLKIDADAGTPLRTIAELQGMLARAGKRLRALQQSRSRSGDGWHLRLWVTPPCRSLTEVIALQAICGSDPYREANNLLRATRLGCVTPFWRRPAAVNVLYDPNY